MNENDPFGIYDDDYLTFNDMEDKTKKRVKSAPPLPKRFKSVEEANKAGYIYGVRDFFKDPLCKALGYNSPWSIASFVHKLNHDWIAKVPGGSFGEINIYHEKALEAAHNEWHNMNTRLFQNEYKALEESNEKKPYYSDDLEIIKVLKMFIENFDLIQSATTEAPWVYFASEFGLNKTNIKVLKSLLKI